MRSFLSAIWIIIAAGLVHGETLVVRQEHPAASDENPGTDDRPLKTISAAATKVKAGDKVIVHRGDYRETVIINASGTEARPIVFEAAPNETPVIKGSDILTGWERGEGQIWKVKLPALPPPAADGKSASYWNTNDIRQIFTRDGAMLDAQRLGRVIERSAMQKGTFFCDRETSSLFVWLADSASPIDHPLEISRRGAWLIVNGSHVIVRGLAMRHASMTAIANWPACSLNGDNIVLENCLISWGDFVGVTIAGKSNRLSHNIIACHGDCGAGGTGENHTIENCRFIFNNVDHYDPQWHAGGAKLIPNFQHGVIRHNEFAHNLGPGLWLDGLCNENVIDGNYAHDNTGAGIMVEISKGNLVMNNLCVANQNLRSASYRDDEGKEKFDSHSEKMVAPSRLFRPYHAGGGRGIYISSAPATKVLHNTAFLNEAEGICVEGPPRDGGAGMLATEDSVVMNNISVFNHGAQLTLRPGEPGKETLGNSSDYNLIFSVGAVLARDGWSGASTFDLPQWQETSGQDNHSLDADPRFAMPVMKDFRLMPDSPAGRAGKLRPEVDHDYNGDPRGPDHTAMGAFEAAAENYPRSVMSEAALLDPRGR